MTIHVTADHIAYAQRGTLECPVYLAAQAAGLDVQLVGVGVEHPHSDTAAGRLYVTHGGESIIQPVPAHVIQVIRAYDKTGVMNPFSFDIPLNT